MAESPQKVRLGFVGLGKYADDLAQAALRCDNIQITACFTRTPDKRHQFAQTFHCRPVDSFPAICDADDVDAIVLVTPNDVHAEQAMAAAASGKHVFVEKPICNTLAGADAMIAACHRAGVVLAVGHQVRRSGVYRRWKAMLQAGTLGDPLCFEANHCGDLLRIWPEDDWRFHTQGNSGALLHKGIHKLDLLHYFFGQAESVISLARPLAFNPHVNETTISAFRFPGGLVGSFTSSFRYNHNTIAIIGSEQSVFYSGHDHSFTLKHERTWETQQILCPRIDTLQEQMHQFAQAILGHAHYEVDGLEARHALTLAIGAQEAATTGLPFVFNHQTPTTTPAPGTGQSCCATP